MKNRTKRIFSIFLILCMVVGLIPFAMLPASAGSAVPGVSTTAPIGNLSLLKARMNSGSASKVYFGTTKNNKPAAFRVVGDYYSGLKGYSGTLTLFADGLTDKSIKFDPKGNSNRYANSKVKTAIDNAYKLTGTEKNAVYGRAIGCDKTLGVSGDTIYNALFWAPTTSDANTLSNDLRKAEDDWWLCSPGDAVFSAACVRKDGTVVPGGNFVSYASGVRAGFYLRTDPILFVSAAAGCKTRAVVGGSPLKSLAPAADAQEKGLKLTLKDDAHKNFRVTKFTKTNESEYTISYENAQIGTNEYISYYVLDTGDNVVAYGKLCKPTSKNGTLSFRTVKIHSDEKLYIINEQANADYMTDYASAPQGYDLIEGDYVIITTLAPGKCFDIAGGANAKSVGDLLQIWDTSNSGAKAYNIQYDANAGAYIITAKQSGLVLDDCGNGNVAQWKSHGGWNQRWIFEPIGNGFYYIRNLSTGKYLTVSNASTSNGTKILAMSFTGEWKQQFSFVPLSELEPEEGQYVITSFLDSSKCLDILGGANAKSNGQNLQLWDVTNSGAKYYTLTKDTTTGSFVITADQSGLLLTANSELSTDRNWASVFQYSGSLSDGNRRQRWTFYPFGNGTYMIQSNQTGFFLNVASATPSNGTGVIAFKDGRAVGNQLFRLVRVQEEASEQPADGDYIIYTAMNDKKCLNIEGGADAMSNGDKVQIWDDYRSNANLYNLRYDDQTGGYIITAKHSGLVLEVADGSTADGAVIRQWEDQGKPNQRWIFEPADDGTYYIRAMQGAYLNVSGGSTSNGSKLISFRFEGGDNEMFKLQRVYVNRYGTIKYEMAGSALSGGTLWILLAALALLAVGGTAAIVIAKKKKKLSPAGAAPASEEADDNEE